MNLFRSLPLGSRHFYAYAVGGCLREVGAEVACSKSSRWVLVGKCPIA
jgi:hypothetical protein